MTVEPKNWNVVVIGSWNLAILTPQGIATRLFGLPDGSPIEVHIPIDVRGPYKVHHDSLTVVASEGQLIIEPDKQSFDELERALQLAQRSIEDLPETPFTAAGFNVRYKVDPAPAALHDLLRCALDDKLSDAGRELTSSLRKSSWQYQ